jgi:hypothetical protein
VTLGSATVLDRETQPRRWRLGAKVRRGGGGGSRLGGPDDSEVDAVVALGYAPVGDTQRGGGEGDRQTLAPRKEEGQRCSPMDG